MIRIARFAFLRASFNCDSFSFAFSKSDNSSSSLIILDDFFCLFLDTLRIYNKSNNLQSFHLCVIPNLERSP